MTVTGPPGELPLFAFGRQDHARVDLDGEPGAVAALRHAAPRGGDRRRGLGHRAARLTEVPDSLGGCHASARDPGSIRDSFGGPGAALRALRRVRRGYGDAAGPAWERALAHAIGMNRDEGRDPLNWNAFITCAITGAGDTVGRSPHVPVTPEQIADLGDRRRGGRRRGRAHPRARSRDRQQRPRPAAATREVVERIRASEVDVVLNLTAGMGGDLVLGGDEAPLPLDAAGTDMARRDRAPGPRRSCCCPRSARSTAGR